MNTVADTVAHTKISQGIYPFADLMNTIADTVAYTKISHGIYQFAVSEHIIQDEFALLLHGLQFRKRLVKVKFERCCNQSSVISDSLLLIEV